MDNKNSVPSDNGKKFVFVSVPIWYGAGKRGTEYGPAALKKFGLEEKLRAQDLKIAGWCQVDPEPIKSADSSLLNYELEIAFTQRGVFRIVNGLLLQGYIPIVVGGDHTEAIGHIAGQAIHVGAARKIGVIWIDQHFDAHTPETSPSKHIHGMPLAVLLGHGSKKLKDVGGQFDTKVYPQNVVHIGGGSWEPKEMELFIKQRISFFPKKELDTAEGFARMLAAITKLAKKVETIVVTIDMDAFDKKDAPGVHFPYEDGITRVQARALFNHIKTYCPNIGGIDIAELVRRKDKGNKTVSLVYDILTWLLVP